MATYARTAAQQTYLTLIVRRQCALLLVLALLMSAALIVPTPDPARAVSPQLRRYPYLTDVVGPYATINWATDTSATVGIVKWGRVGSESCTAHSTVATKTTLNFSGVQEY